MDMKQKKLLKLLITAVCLIALYALCIIMDQTITATSRLYMLITVVRKSAVYALVAVSMNLLNGFTGLFSLGQAGFMLIGAYTYAIFSIPSESIDSVYQYYDAAIHFSFQEAINGIFGLEAMAAPGLIIGALLAMILAGLVAAFFAWLIGLPVLRLKSDYLAIATLGFAEIIKAIFQWQKFGPITNGSNVLRGYTRLSDFTFNIGGPRSPLAPTFAAVLPSPRCAYSSSCCSSTPATAAPSRRYVRTRWRRRPWACASSSTSTWPSHKLLLRRRRRRAAGHVHEHSPGGAVQVHHDLRDTAHRRPRRPRLRDGQLHSQLPVHSLLRVVAARP